MKNRSVEMRLSFLWKKAVLYSGFLKSDTGRVTFFKKLYSNFFLYQEIGEKIKFAYCQCTELIMRFFCEKGIYKLTYFKGHYLLYIQLKNASHAPPFC